MPVKPVLNAIQEQAVLEQSDHVVNGRTHRLIFEAESFVDAEENKLRRIVSIQNSV